MKALMASLFAAAAVASPLRAQTVPTIPQTGVTTGSLPAAGLPVSSRADLAGVFGTKADATAGVLTTPKAFDLSIGVDGYPTSPGALVSGGWHPSWPTIKTGVAHNGTQWQIYPNADQGTAQTVSGTNQVVATGSSPFLTSWVGKNVYINTPNYKGWGSDVFTVVTVTDATHMTVKNTDGSAVVWPDNGSYTWHFVLTTADNICNVAGTAVTYVSGQPFILYTTTLTVNGTPRTATFVDPSHMTLSVSAGTLTNATCHQEFNDFDGLSLLRLQKTIGANEESLAVAARAVGEYSIYASVAGTGSYYPIVFYTGTTGTNIAPLLALVPDAASTVVSPRPGYVALGGYYGFEAMRVLGGLTNANRFEVSGAPTAFPPGARGRGTDTNVGLSYDTQGAGTHTFSSHVFTNTEFQVFGNGGTSWLTVGSDASAAPSLAAAGAATDISVKLWPKGAGVVKAMTPVQLPAYTVATLPTCNAGIIGSMAVVSNALAPAYNAVVAGGGAIWTPVMCNGGGWTAH